MKQNYAPKSTNRFEASVTEESERAKNKGETILNEYYDKYFGKTKHGSEKVEAPRSSQSTGSFLTQFTTNKALSELPVDPAYQNGVPVAQQQPHGVSTGYQQSVAIPQGLPQVLPVPQGYPQGYPQEYQQGYTQAPIFNPNRHYSYLVNHG